MKKVRKRRCCGVGELLPEAIVAERVGCSVEELLSLRGAPNSPRVVLLSDGRAFYPDRDVLDWEEYLENPDDYPEFKSPRRVKALEVLSMEKIKNRRKKSGR